MGRKTVRNMDLPVSSYSKSRNEMQSKILGPLSKLVEETFGMRLEITSSGSMSDFTIELGDTDVLVGVVKKFGR